MDIAYLFFVSFECYFVLHGTLWHESPVVPLETNETDNQNNFIISAFLVLAGNLICGFDIPTYIIPVRYNRIIH